MKKLFFFISFSFLVLTGCSEDKDNEIQNEGNSIIGKWYLIKENGEDGTSKSLDDCEKKGNLTFTNKTFSLYGFSKVNGVCEQIESQENVEYKLIDDVININISYDNGSGETIKDVSKVKIKFTENGNLEVYEADDNGIPIDNFPRQVWSK